MKHRKIAFNFLVFNFEIIFEKMSMKDQIVATYQESSRVDHTIPSIHCMPLNRVEKFAFFQDFILS